MIQRKQTLWLALISLISLSSIYINIHFRDLDGKIDGKMIEDAIVHVGFSYTSIEIIGKENPKIIPNTFLKYCCILIGFNSLVSIFLYNKRKYQILISQVNYVLILIMSVLMFYYGWSKRYVDLEPDGQTVISILFPLLLGFLNYLAMSGVKNDEKLVKSYDRIR